MNDLWVRNDRPIPASYLVTAGIGSLVTLACYGTAYWVPWFVQEWGVGLGPQVSAIGSTLVLMFGAAIGLVLASLPWLSLRWPLLAVCLALAPVVPTLIDDTPLHFGVFASLGAVALTAGWRSAGGSLSAIAAMVIVTLGWIASGQTMVAPFRAVIFIDDYSTGRLLGLGALYLAVVVLVAGGALGLRVTAEREIERKSLAARSVDVEEQAAVVGERARLARDLHDVVAHHVSLIAVRAETAPYTHPQIDDQARGVLTDIASDARLALDELRGVLGILGRSGTAQRAPQPTWSDISALVERTRSAGVDIDLVGDVSAEVGPSSGYAAYRVVQEALTNARKHAPGKVVTLDLEATSQLLTVLVSTPRAATADVSGTGHGLVGMRERVEALGGRLLAGPVGEDFVVEAILPRGTT